MAAVNKGATNPTDQIPIFLRKHLRKQRNKGEEYSWKDQRSMEGQAKKRREAKAEIKAYMSAPQSEPDRKKEQQQIQKS